MTDHPPLLLVEDEPHLARGLIFNLEEEGYRVTHVETGEEALQQLDRSLYAMLILDLMLPGIDGLKVCEQLREAGNQIPILMLTARGSDEERVTGLSKGADDYLAKPFNLREFLLRVAGLLRRSNWPPEDAGVYRFGKNRINRQTHQADTPRGQLQLTDLEMKMLQLFISREGQVLSRGEILRQVWGMSPRAETRTVDNFIVRLRKYFETNPAKPRHFRTVRGRGYRFVQDPG